MYRILWAASCVLVSVMAAGAAAQQERRPGPPDEGSPGVELNVEVLDQFDVDGDGQLSDDELGQARRWMGALRRLIAERGDRPRAEGRRDRPRADAAEESGPTGTPEEGVADDRPRGERPRPDRGPRSGDRRRPGVDGAGPPEAAAGGPRNQARRVFREFDADRDGQLSPDEFAAAMAWLNERRGPAAGPDAPRDRLRLGPGGPPEGRRFGPGGPPEGRPFGRRGGPSAGDDGAFRGPGGPPAGLDEESPGEPSDRPARPRGGRGPRADRPGRPAVDAPAADAAADGEVV